MSQVEERRQTRFAYQADIDLAAIDESKQTVGKAVNLSPNGLLVRVPEPWQVGEEVFCQLPLGEERRTLVGRVVWVDNATDEDGQTAAGAAAVPAPPPTDVEMGVEFVAYSDRDATCLTQQHPTVTQETTPADPQKTTPANCPKRVRVFFPETQQSIHAEAVHCADAIYLCTSLPFVSPRTGLQIIDGPDGSGSSLPGNQQTVTPAIVEGVELIHDGKTAIPWLRIKVGTVQAPSASEPSAAPQHDSAAEGTGDKQPAMPPQPAACTVPPPKEARLTPPASSWAGRPTEIAEDVPRWADTELDTSSTNLPDLTSWRVETFATDPEVDEHTDDDEAASRWGRWLSHPASSGAAYWAGAAILVGFLGFLGVQHLLRDKTETPAPAAVAADPTPAKPQMPEAGEAPTPAYRAAPTDVIATPSTAPRAQPTEAPASAPTPQPSARSQSIPLDPQGRPRIIRRASKITVQIPLVPGEQPPTVTRSYSLTTPVGVAVNVTGAASRIPYALYHLTDADVSRVWIRNLEEGMQVRVFVTGSVPPHEVEVTPTQLSITLLP